PYTVWQAVRGWPLITYWQGYQANRMNPSGLLQFFWRLLMDLNPVLLLAGLLGLAYLLFHPEGKKYRPLGLSFLVLLVFYGYLKLDPHLLVSACFPLLAAGAVWLEKLNYNRMKAGGFLAGQRPAKELGGKPEAAIKLKLSAEAKGLNPVVETISIGAATSSRSSLGEKGTFRLTPWLVRVYLGAILISGALLAPLALPLLPSGALEKYVAATPRFIMESLNNQRTKLPAHLANRFGWPELVEKVAEVYHGFPELERKQCAIWTEIYPHAGAIDLLGKKYGLPNAISTHLSYYFWGPDPNRTGVDPKVVIVLSFTSRIPYAAFDEVTRADFMIDNPLALPLVRDLSIYVCRKPKRPLKEIWPSLVSYY
ncbi:MAG TPA: hypothetical protein VHY08_11360, partial [Bacillota bacterium]|nr:hypothetical protein [Bacillota bacterium]